MIVAYAQYGNMLWVRRREPTADAVRWGCVMVNCIHVDAALVLAIGVDGDLCPPLISQWDQVFGKNDRLLASKFIWHIHMRTPLGQFHRYDACIGD